MLRGAAVDCRTVFKSKENPMACGGPAGLTHIGGGQRAVLARYSRALLAVLNPIGFGLSEIRELEALGLC